jgi:hypothetical protein
MYIPRNTVEPFGHEFNVKQPVIIYARLTAITNIPHINKHGIQSENGWLLN